MGNNESELSNELNSANQKMRYNELRADLNALKIAIKDKEFGRAKKQDPMWLKIGNGFGTPLAIGLVGIIGSLVLNNLQSNDFLKAAK